MTARTSTIQAPGSHINRGSPDEYDEEEDEVLATPHSYTKNLRHEQPASDGYSKRPHSPQLEASQISTYREIDEHFIESQTPELVSSLSSSRSSKEMHLTDNNGLYDRPLSQEGSSPLPDLSSVGDNEELLGLVLENGIKEATRGAVDISSSDEDDNEEEGEEEEAEDVHLERDEAKLHLSDESPRYERRPKKKAGLHGRGETSDVEIIGEQFSSSRHTRNSNAHRKLGMKPSVNSSPMEDMFMPVPHQASLPIQPPPKSSIPMAVKTPQSPRQKPIPRKRRNGGALKNREPREIKIDDEVDLHFSPGTTTPQIQNQQNHIESEALIKYYSPSIGVKHPHSPSPGPPRKKKRKSKSRSQTPQALKSSLPSIHSPPFHQLPDLDDSFTQDQLINHIIYDMQPSNFAEIMPFMKGNWYANKKAPQEFLAKDVEARINDIYKQCQESLYISLQNNPSNISLSLRLFSCPSDTGDVTFLQIFGHWLDQDMEYNVRLLDFWCIPPCNTRQDFLFSIAMALFRTLLNFGIEYKVFAVTMDREMGGLGAQSLIRQLNSVYPKDGPQKAPEFHVVYSLSLTLDGIATRFLEHMHAQAWPPRVWYNFALQAEYTILDRSSTIYDHPVTALRVIVHYFAGHTEEWDELCSGLGVRYNAPPVSLDVVNDWMSTYEMLRIATKYQKIIDHATESVRALMHCKITAKEWGRIKDIRQFLHILRKFKGDGNDYNPQFNLYAMILWKIQLEHNDVLKRAKPYDKFEEDVCSAFVKACDHYPWIFDTEQWPYQLPFFGSILDPRQRTAIIADSMTPSTAAEWKMKLINFAKRYSTDTYSEPQAVINVDEAEESSNYDSSNSEGTNDKYSPRYERKLPSPKVDNTEQLRAASRYSNDDNSSDSDDDDIKILDEKIVLGAPGRTAHADLHDYFAESLVKYDSLLRSDVVMKYWIDKAEVHPEFFGVARDVLAVATGSEESSARLLGRDFDALVGNRWDQVPFEWLRKLVFLRAVLNEVT